MQDGIRKQTGASTRGTPTAIEIVQKFSHLRALVIGDAMLDTYLEGVAARLCSEGPVPVVRKTTEERIPGGAANSAANLCALNAAVTFLGMIGRDITGTLLHEALRERGIDDRWLIEDATTSTLHKLRILSDGQYVVRFDEGSAQRHDASPYTPESRQALLAALEEGYAQCDLVIVSDYCYGTVFDELIERLHALHEAHPKVLLIDSKALQRFQQLKATIVTPNYQEACRLVQEHAGWEKDAGHEVSLEQARHIAQQLLARLATRHIAITLADHGVLLLDRRGKATHIPAHRVAHANDVGAGDSFSAALALALAAGGSIEEATRIGIDAAGIAVTKRRTAVVEHQELLQRVSLRVYSAQAVSHDGQQEEHDDAWRELASLRAQLEVERLNGRTIVFTNGVFDILHAGHVQLLRQAKALGDVLVVGLNSDSSTRRLKGPTRPINYERDRLALVEALDMVDYAILFDEATPTELIRLLRPHIHVKGGDYDAEKLPEAAAVRAAGGRVVIIPLVGSLSTSHVIERILYSAHNGQISTNNPDNNYSQQNDHDHYDGQTTHNGHTHKNSQTNVVYQIQGGNYE